MHILIHGCDMCNGGQKLGPMTHVRIKRAVEYARSCAAATLWAGAGFSPDCPGQVEKMSTLIVRCVQTEYHFHNARTFDGPEFSSSGEVQGFLDIVRDSDAVAVVSSWWHLPRIFLVVWKCAGLKGACTIRYVPSWDMPPAKLLVLEPFKYLHLFLPKRVQVAGQRVYRMMFGSYSW